MAETSIRRVLVPMRPLQPGLPPAAYHGRVLAERFGAALTLMSSVYDPTVAMHVSRGREGAETTRDRMIDAERLSLERLAESLRSWGIEVDVEVRWQQPPYEAVLASLADRAADLVAVDVLHPRPAFRPRLLDTDWQLMLRCPCPVLYVNDPEFASYDTIVAAIDPLHAGPRVEQTDRAVLAHARAFATAFGADLRVVHAYPDLAAYAWVSAVEVEPGVFFGTENLESAHREAVEATAGEHGIAAEQIDLRAGDPRDVILGAAQERNAKLIVIGALERGELEQAMLGSTAEAIVAEADCDVLLVKA